MRLLSSLAKEQREFDLQDVLGRFMFCLFLRVAFHEDEMALEILSADPKSLESKPAYVAAYDKATHCELLLFHPDIYEPHLTCPRYSV